MPRDYKAYLEDILEAGRKIRSYTEDLTHDSFQQNPMAVDAVMNPARRPQPLTPP